MSDVQMQLAAGNYAAAIQDELGNMGATATMSQGGVVVTGSVGVAPVSGSQSLRSTQPAVIISLSPAAHVAGLDLQDNTVLTGTSERVNMSMNEAWMASQDSSKGTYSTGLFIPVVGGIYVTWANPAASASSDP